jgi:hypothetical protein
MCAIVLLFQGVSDPLASKQKKKKERKKERRNYVVSYQVLSKVPLVPKTPVCVCVCVCVSLSLCLMPS